MTRARRIAAIVGLSLLGLIVVVFVAAIIVVQTSWFHNFVREKIISVTEESTGGKVEVAAFDFDWTHLRATVRGFVLHGSEAPASDPLFQARTLVVELKIIPNLGHTIDLRTLTVDTPRANVIVNADGSTNVPAPKVKKQSDKSALETIVDLAVKRFDLNNGSFTFASHQMPLDAHGKNLHAQLLYNMLNTSYEGRIALDPLLFNYAKNDPVNIHVELPVKLQKDRITLDNASIATPQSRILLSGAVENMTDPRTSLHANAQLSVPELARVAGLQIANQPDILNADVALAIDKDRIQISTARATLGHSNLEASGVLKDPQGQGSVQLNGTFALAEIGHLFRVAQQPGGTAQLAANVKLLGNSEYQAAGNLHATGVSFLQDGKRYRNIALATAFSANPNEIALNGLKLDAFGGEFAGNADVKQMRAFTLSGDLRHFDLATLMQTFTGKPGGYSGTVSGPVTAHGDLKNPSGVQAKIQLAIAPGKKGLPVSGRIVADYNGATGAIALGNTHLALPHTNLDVSGTVGRQVQVKLVTRDLNDFAPALGDTKLPIQLGGSASFDGTVSGAMTNPRIIGHVAVNSFTLEGRSFDRLTADLNASPSGASIQNGILTRGPMQTQLSANVALRKWQLEPNLPLSVNAAIRNGDVADLLALAGQPPTGVSGPLTAVVQITGTESNLAAHIQADSQFQMVRAPQPATSGAANVNLDATASLVDPKGKFDFQLTGVNGNVNVRNLRADNQNYGNLTAVLRTANKTVHYDVNSDLAGSTIRVNGDTRLQPEYPTTATASIANLALDRVLLLAGRRDIPAKGTLSANASFSGTLDNPGGNADLTLANAVLYDEPLDRLHARVNMTPLAVTIPTAEVQSGPSRIAMNAAYTHPKGDLYDGQIRFHVDDSTVQLDRLRTIQKYRPGLAGVVRLVADGAADLKNTKAGEQFQLASLNANASANNLALDRAKLGDVKLVAQTRGDRLSYSLDSDFANAAIHGKGATTLRADYPTSAQLSFDKLTYSGLRPFLKTASNPPAAFEAAAAGEVNINGPLTRMDELKGRLQLSRLELSSTTRPGEGGKPIVIKNQGPIVMALDRSVVKVESAHLTGPQTDVQLTGTAPLTGSAQLNVNLAANTNLALLQDMSRSIYSSGAVVVQAAVRGTLTDPLVNGRMELKNASFNYVDLPNGISNANGVILFNGNNASIQSLTAETGGGKLTAGGFVGFGGGDLTYNLKTTATAVRVRYPQGASVVAGANITLNGSSQRSVLSGTVTVNQIGFSPRSDFGSMLSRTAAPVQAPSAPSGPLAGMTLDVRIRTAPDVSLQTALAEKLQADADLHLRGTLANPGMTGRVNITEGDLVFFGTKYTVNQGTIAFYNPFAIQPILNIDLETVAKGVDVVLNMSGPVDNMKLTYHSDPPLQFNELVALLATGKTPTSDPTLVAREPATPPQTFQQMGESAIVGQAIANPVASHLQRVFGVNKLKIDPTFTSGSELPQARLTLQQQITNNVTFTYITNLTQANSQIIRVEWAFNEQWSAIATREENGRFGVDFFYKKKFR